MKRVILVLVAIGLLLAAATSVRIYTAAPITGGPFVNSGTIGCPTCVTSGSVVTSVGTPGSDKNIPSEQAVRTLFSAGTGEPPAKLCSVALSAAPVFDAGQCSVFRLTLGATAVTGPTLTGPTPGQSLTFFITQDSTGNRAFPWPVEVEKACMVASEPDSTTVLSAVFDGQKAFALGCTTSLPGTLITGPTRIAPPAPIAGFLSCWFDARGEGGVFACRDFGGNVQSMARFVDGETPGGIVDGVNGTFTLSLAPNPPGSLRLYRNGLVQKQGAAGDFTLSGNTITFSVDAVPQATGMPDVLVAFYRY